MSGSLLNYLSNNVGSGDAQLNQAVNSFLDPAASIQRQIAQAGGNPTNAAFNALANQSPPVATAQSGSSELRAVLNALSPTDVYASSPIMSILASTNGMLFPYTPTINFSQAVNYTDLQLVHSDTDYPAYTRTPTCTLSVTGKFTVQNQREGQYAMACIHFLRTVSKSYFGEIDAAAGKAGLPPPVLTFSAYGPYVFNKLRCVLKSHSWTFDEQMDTVTLIVNGGTVRLPAMFTIQCELMVVQTPTRMRRTFSFDQFASGALMTGDGGWV